MKTTLFLLSLLFSVCAFSQTSQLENHTWYLDHLIIDSETFINPAPHNELEQVIADFSEEGFQTMICSSLMANLNYDDNQNTFTIAFYSQTMENCVSSENSTFENQYFNEFFLLNESPTEQYNFQYSIGDDGTSLSIVNPNGDVAFFWNEVLSSSSFDSKKLAIYPNPSESYFSIEGTENLSIEKLKIYDLQGKLIKTLDSNSENTYDSSDLNRGVYILKINGEKGVFNQKLVVE
ncbi:MAG: T9SS type A sorting domain-containing protein [Psychroflexus sp.]